MYYRKRPSKLYIGNSGRIFGRSLSPCSGDETGNPNLSVVVDEACSVVVDEAAQMFEAESCAAFNLAKDRVILFGHHHQLPARIRRWSAVSRLV